MDKMRFRQLNLDFNTSADIKGVGEKFDKKQFQDALKRGHIDSVNLFSKCHHGYAYHPSEANQMHPELKFDLLGAQIEACREIGVETPIYISAGVDEKYAFDHPDCVVRFSPNYPIDFLTEARYHTLCFNSPYLEVLLAQIREVMERYHPKQIFLDICDVRPCYCNYCTKTKRELGLSTTDDADAMKLGRMVFYHYCEEVERVVREVDHDTAIFHNAGRIPLDDRRFCSYDSHFEVENLPTGGWGYDHFPMAASYVRNLGKEYLGMTGKFHRMWGEFGGFKHPNALRYENSLALAFGAKCSVGDQLHPSGIMDMATYELIGKSYSEVEQKEPWCRDVEAVSDIAVLSHRFSPGASRILLEKKYLFDFVDFECDISKYKLVILPDRVLYTDTLAEKLKAYISEGGKILASGSSCFDENGRFLGLDCLKKTGINQNKPNYMRPRSADGFTNGITEYLMGEDSYTFTCDESFRVFADTVDTYFNRTAEHFCSHEHSPHDPESCYPGVVINDSIAYVPWKVFADYAEVGSLHLKELVVRLISELTDDSRYLYVNGLPDRGVVTLMKQPCENRLINHILFAYTSVRGRDVEVIEDTVPIYNVGVRVKSDKRPENIFLEPQHEAIPFEYNGFEISYTVPKVELHQMAVIEF